MGVGGQVRVGQAISLINGSMSHVPCKHAMRRPSERRCTTEEMAHLLSPELTNSGNVLEQEMHIFLFMSTIDSEGENTNTIVSFFSSVTDHL